MEQKGMGRFIMNKQREELDNNDWPIDHNPWKLLKH